MKKLVKVVSLMLVIIMGLSLVACGEKTVEIKETGSETQSASTNEAGEATDATEVKSEDPVELSIMHFLVRETGTGQDLTMLDRIDAFLESHPNVTLNQEIMSHDSYEQKIKTLAAANEMPDIFFVKGSMVDTFVENDIIAPLNSALDERPEWKDGFKDGIFDDFMRETDIYGIPFALNITSLIYYNEAILKEVGINEFPKTWVEFETAIIAIKAAGYTPIALGNKGKWVAESCILSTLGDRFTGSEWFGSVKNKEASFEDPDFVKALDAFQGLAEIGAFNDDMNSIDNNQQKTLFYAGNAAMFMEGSWAISSVEQDAPEEISSVTGVALIPSVDGGKGEQAAVSGGAGWAIQINPKLEGAEREAALDLIEMLSDTEAATLAVEANSFPASIPGEYDQTKLTPLMLKVEELLKGVQYTPIYDVQLSPSIIETMNSGLQELLSGIITPEELAAKIQKENK